MLDRVSQNQASIHIAERDALAFQRTLDLFFKRALRARSLTKRKFPLTQAVCTVCGCFRCALRQIRSPGPSNEV